MKSTLARDRSPVGLVLILVSAATLRLWALDWGAPYVYHPDEHLIVHPALDIVRNSDPNPHWFQYPSLMIYLEAAVIAVMQPFVHAPLVTDASANRIGPWDVLPAQWPFVFAGRCAVALFGLAGAWLLWRIGCDLGGPGSGAAAAMFLIAAPLHNESTHYLTTDVAAATLLTSALLWSARSGRRNNLVVAGFLAGLAAATKYTAGIVILVPLALAVGSAVVPTLQRVLLIGGAAAAGFLLACPYAAFDVSSFWQGLQQQRQNYLGGYGGAGNWRWYLGYLYNTGLTPTLAAACGLGWLAGIQQALRSFEQSHIVRRFYFLMTAVPAAYFALLSSYPSRAERNLLLILPFVFVLAAVALRRVVHALLPVRLAEPAVVLAALLIALPGLLASAGFDRVLTRPDTRTQALEWIDANLPQHSRVAREEYTPQIDGKRFDVTYLWSLAFRDYSWYLSEHIDYLVLSSNVYDRVLNPPYAAGPTGPPFYRFVFLQLPLVVEIKPSPEGRGPVIRIYQVPHAE